MKKVLATLMGLVMVLVATGVCFAGSDLSMRNSVSTEAALVAQTGDTQAVKIHQNYEFWCYDRAGNLKWHEIVRNIVTTAGLNKYLDCALKTGCSSPAWYMGLVTGPGSGTTYALGDTLLTHGGWTENTDYTGNRKAVTLGAISGGSVDNSAAKASFSINNTATIAGAFICDAATGTSGTLLGGNDFTGGDRSVVSGDTINGQVTFTISN